MEIAHTTAILRQGPKGPLKALGTLGFRSDVQGFRVLGL